MKIILIGLTLLTSTLSMASNFDPVSFNMGKIEALKELKQEIDVQDATLLGLIEFLEIQIVELENKNTKLEASVEERHKKLDAFFEQKNYQAPGSTCCDGPGPE